jgi:hypothetical protein
LKNTRQYILTGLALALMGAAAAVLIHMRAYQRLGDPGVKTRPIAGSKNLEILMPENLPGYTSEILTNGEDALTALPPDTSYRVRRYTEPDNFSMQMTTVLMGTDRTSIHQPQICLPGQGWTINDSQTKVVNIPMKRPIPYDLPVNKLISTIPVQDKDGNPQILSSVYLYWYVDGDQFTASSTKWKIWLMPRDLLTRGVLDRWAYITCFSQCLPGQEDATFERMKKIIGDTVPEFQLVPLATR